MGEKIPDDLRKAAHNAYADLLGCDNLTERREAIARALLAERMAERARCETAVVSLRFRSDYPHDLHTINEAVAAIRNQDKP